MESTKKLETVDPRYPNTPIGIVRSRDAFLRDLPALLANPKYDRWLAMYCGDERIALAETHAEIDRQCKGRELKDDEYYLGGIHPQGGDDEVVELGGNEFEELDVADGNPLPDRTDSIP